MSARGEGTGRALLILSLAILAIVGSAGLSSLIGEDDCFDAYAGPIPPRTEGVIGTSDFSLWPPGTVCQTVVGGATFETGGDPLGFLVIVALSLSIIVVAFRSPTPASGAVRFATAGVIGLTALGVGGMFDMPTGAMLGFLLSPPLAYVTEHALLGRRIGDRVSAAGSLAALAGAAWVFVGTALWLAGFESLGFATVLMILAVMAAISAPSAVGRESSRRA